MWTSRRKKIQELEAELAEIARKHEALKEENRALKHKLESEIGVHVERDMLMGILINCARTSIVLKNQNLCKSILRDFCKANGIDLTEPARWSKLYMSTFLRDMIRWQSDNPSNIRGYYSRIRMKLPKRPVRPVVKNKRIDEKCRKVGQDLQDHLEGEMEEEMSR